MKVLSRREFLEKGIASGLWIAAPGYGHILKSISYPADKIESNSFNDNKPDEFTPGIIVAGTGQIPEWLHCPRFYTVDYRRDVVMDEKWISNPGEISNLVKTIADNGASALRLGTCWGGEVFYQSRIAPHSSRLGHLDYLREAVEQGKQSGVKILAYINPNALYTDHPLAERCAVRDSQGNVWNIDAYGIKSTRYACTNNPDYRKFLMDILSEIFMEYQPDGLYVDGLTSHICFCRHCQEKYYNLYKTEIPVKFQKSGPVSVLWEMTSCPELIGDLHDRDSKAITQFLYNNLTDITKDFTLTVKSCKSDAVTMYHSWPKADTLPYYDGTLGEIYVNQPWVHILWKTGELTNYGAVFPILVLQNIYLRKKTEQEGRNKIFQVLANGMLPNCWYLQGMKTCFDYLRENARYYDQTTTNPFRFMAFPRAIHEDAVQRQIIKDYKVPGPRSRFLAPYAGFYSAILRSELPITTIHRPGFHQKIDGLKVLCLINEASISDEQVDRISRFVSEGGALIATGETSLYDQNGIRRPDFALKDLFGASFTDILPPGNRSVIFSGRYHITKSLKNTGIDYDESLLVVKPTGCKVAGWVIDKNKEHEKIPAAAINKYGLGRVVFIPARLDSIQCEKLTPEIEQLFKNAVHWATEGNVPIQIESEKAVGVTMFEQSGRIMIHLVNYNSDTRQDSEPCGKIYNIRMNLIVPAGRKLTRLYLLWQKKELGFSYKTNRVNFMLDELGEYEVVVAELG
jgi:hypothetical protein